MSTVPQITAGLDGSAGPRSIVDELASQGRGDREIRIQANLANVGLDALHLARGLVDDRPPVHHVDETPREPGACSQSENPQARRCLSCRVPSGE